MDEPNIAVETVARLIVGATTAPVKVWSTTEGLALRLLGRRIDAARTTAPATAAADTDNVPTAPTVAERLARLMQDSVAQSSTQGRQAVFDRVLSNLVPDEARILDRLHRDGGSPLVRVVARGRAGSSGERLLDDMSLVGKQANVAQPQLTPTYVAHLRSLGLVRLDPEDVTRAEDFEILEADGMVLAALKHGGRGPLAPRTERFMLRLSPFGTELMSAADGESQ